jgi:hypothetical protein
MLNLSSKSSAFSNFTFLRRVSKEISRLNNDCAVWTLFAFRDLLKVSQVFEISLNLSLNSLSRLEVHFMASFLVSVLLSLTHRNSSSLLKWITDGYIVRL